MPRAEVWLARCPLAGTTHLQKLVPLLQHTPFAHWMLLMEEKDGACTALDFLPVEPLSPVVAATLASGGAVPGAHVSRAGLCAGLHAPSVAQLYGVPVCLKPSACGALVSVLLHLQEGFASIPSIDDRPLCRALQGMWGMTGNNSWISTTTDLIKACRFRTMIAHIT